MQPANYPVPAIMLEVVIWPDAVEIYKRTDVKYGSFRYFWRLTKLWRREHALHSGS